MTPLPAKKLHNCPERAVHSETTQSRNKETDLQRMFDLLGWTMLPLNLKYTIREDVKGVVDELEGRYATCDPAVQRRRHRVIYWVEQYLDGVCSAQTAVEALSYQS